MKKLFLKMLVYTVLIFLLLELFVRVFHLTKDYPIRYVDSYGVEKWRPNQDGYSVTGNRRQNFSKFHINNFGYNSYREFTPSKDKNEIALVGDSFIEGFHQNYTNSIGKKMEETLHGVEVYEYGYAGYDLADQLHLIKQYKDQFDLIDYVVIGLDFDTDLSRGTYEVVEDRMRLESGKYKAVRQIKLLMYLQAIGVFDAPKKLFQRLTNHSQERNNKLTAEQKEAIYSKHFNNFKSLIDTYGFDTSRFIFLLDSEKTSASFLKYLNDNHYKYIDFSEALNVSSKPVSLIYDQHWNDLGRTIVANTICDYIENIKNP